ncbi:hypothetical protein, partial [Klebsiella oxytoca]|uniref:hypothetical protein n=1 Tax=Klebsiella oxytoca TaxID=571 RepID=UPI001918A203
VPLIALVWLALEGDADTARIVSAALGAAVLVAAVVVFAAVLRTDSAAERFGRAAARVVSPVSQLAHRPSPAGWDAALSGFRTRAAALVEARWPWLTLTTVMSHLSLYAVLLAAIRAIGVGAEAVSASEILAVFAFARLLTAIPLTPGG